MGRYDDLSCEGWGVVAEETLPPPGNEAMQAGWEASAEETRIEALADGSGWGVEESASGAAFDGPAYDSKSWSSPRAADRRPAETAEEVRARVRGGRQPYASPNGGGRSPYSSPGGGAIEPRRGRPGEEGSVGGKSERSQKFYEGNVKALEKMNLTPEDFPSCRSQIEFERSGGGRGRDGRFDRPPRSDPTDRSDWADRPEQASGDLEVNDWGQPQEQQQEEETGGFGRRRPLPETLPGDGAGYVRTSSRERTMGGRSRGRREPEERFESQRVIDPSMIQQDVRAVSWGVDHDENHDLSDLELTGVPVPKFHAVSAVGVGKTCEEGQGSQAEQPPSVVSPKKQTANKEPHQNGWEIDRSPGRRQEEPSYVYGHVESDAKASGRGADVNSVPTPAQPPLPASYKTAGPRSEPPTEQKPQTPNAPPGFPEPNGGAYRPVYDVQDNAYANVAGTPAQPWAPGFSAPSAMPIPQSWAICPYCHHGFLHPPLPVTVNPPVSSPVHDQAAGLPPRRPSKAVPIVRPSE